MQLDGTATAFAVVDEQGRYLDANDKALAAYGVTIDELRRHKVGDFSPAGLGPVHRTLFRWLIRQDHDFGGGDGTIVSPAGRKTRIRCTSISRIGDHIRIAFVPLPGSEVPPHSKDLPAVLEAWREAERGAAEAPSARERRLAGEVSASLRDIYQYVFDSKT